MIDARSSLTSVPSRGVATLAASRHLAPSSGGSAASSHRQPHLFGDAIGDRFNRWINANPEAYDLFKRFAVQLRAAGRKHFGAKAIVERIRFEYALRRDENEAFKLNNDYTSRLVRLLIADDPTFADFFDTRKLRSD